MTDAGLFDCVIDMICYLAVDAESFVRSFRKRADHVIFCSTAIVYGMPAMRYPVTDRPCDCRLSCPP
jgi:hypothetical protein